MSAITKSMSMSVKPDSPRAPSAFEFAADIIAPLSIDNYWHFAILRLP
jgi:hypothetical protein